MLGTVYMEEIRSSLRSPTRKESQKQRTRKERHKLSKAREQNETRTRASPAVLVLLNYSIPPATQTGPL